MVDADQVRRPRGRMSRATRMRRVPTGWVAAARWLDPRAPCLTRSASPRRSRAEPILPAPAIPVKTSLTIRWFVVGPPVELYKIIRPVRVCEIGGVPLPCAQLLALGDGRLGWKDVEGAIRLYELGDADRERGARVIDLPTARPDQERRAIALAERPW